MDITKEVLSQYMDLQEEIKEVRRRIKNTELQISKIESEGAIIDKVKGGEGGIQNFRIEGFPYTEYSRKKSLLYARKATLAELEMELMEMINKVEEFIKTLNNSRIRRIITHRFIENLSWAQVANRMHTTPDSVRMEFERFMKKS